MIKKIFISIFALTALSNGAFLMAAAGSPYDDAPARAKALKFAVEKKAATCYSDTTKQQPLYASYAYSAYKLNAKISDFPELGTKPSKKWNQFSKARPSNGKKKWEPISPADANNCDGIDDQTQQSSYQDDANYPALGAVHPEKLSKLLIPKPKTTLPAPIARPKPNPTVSQDSQSILNANAPVFFLPKRQ